MRVIIVDDEELARGVVYLIDDRFGQPEVQELLPRWWQLGTRRAEEAEGRLCQASR